MNKLSRNKWIDWKQLGYVYMYITRDFKYHDKIHAFDFDGTLFNTKSGKIYPTSKWDINTQLLIDPKILRSSNTSIVIISNQAGVSSKRYKLSDVQHRLLQGIHELSSHNINTMLLFATNRNGYRKPHTGMWHIIMDIFKHDSSYMNNQSISQNIKYLYVGDAAGRIWDHSVCDREFAFNANIPFKTEKEYKQIHKRRILPKLCKYPDLPRSILYEDHIKIGQSICTVDCDIDYSSAFIPEVFSWKSSIYPISKPKRIDSYEKIMHQLKTNRKNTQNAIILLGYPGSIDDHLIKSIIDNNSQYSIVNGRKEIQTILKAGKSVIITGAHESRKQRQLLVYMINQFSINHVRIILLWFYSTKEMSFHLGRMKVYSTKEMSFHLGRMKVELEPSKKMLTTVLYNSYEDAFQTPHLHEGFDIIKVPFHSCLNKTNLCAFMHHYDSI